MRILDKYILKELLGPFIFGVCAFSSIFIGSGTLFRIAEYVTKYGAPLGLVVKLFIYSLPGIVVYTFPMSMLLAALLSFGRLSGSSEITAMKSGGLSFYRISTPVFIIAFFVSIFAVVFQETVVPASNAAYNHIVKYDIKGNTSPQTQEHLVIKDVKGENISHLTYARKASGNNMYAISIQEFDNGNLVRVENAEQAVWQDNQWVMYNGVVYELTPEGGLERSMHFAQQIMPVDKNPTAISREQKKPEEMTIKELKQHIKALQKEYVKTGTYEVELHHRLTTPLASFVFALIGTPLGLQPNRSSSVTSALGEGGALPAVVATWIPNVIGIIVGGWLIWKNSR
ncbi:MAG: permease YjgP/YjgQ family protein [Firmicutes bacterium]|nr:permease YjgP/YjgQ family protein [Bacillota bacterium]